jgi:hypothetical protein
MQTDQTADDFLFPNMFRTGYDVCEARALKRYLDGKKECEDYEEIYISVNNTVSAKLKGGGRMNGYEKIGYHAYSGEYLRAILDSDCAVYVYRVNDAGRIVKHDLRAMAA